MGFLSGFKSFVGRNALPGAIGFAQGGPLGAGLAIAQQEAQGGVAGQIQGGLGQAAGFQQQGLQAQLAQQQALAPLLQRAGAAQGQLAQFAGSPIGQSEQFREAQRLGTRDIQRGLAAQGSFFSGRTGDALARLNLGLLGQEQQQRLAAQSQLAGQAPGLAQLGISGAQGLGGALTNLGQLSATQGFVGANQAAGRANTLIGGLPALANLAGRGFNAARDTFRSFNPAGREGSSSFIGPVQPRGI